MSIFNIKNSLIVAATLAVTASGCKKSDFAINDNPNSITESTVDYRTVLPASQTLTASIIAADWKFAQNYMGFWARSGSFQDITDEESYNFENDFNAQVWNDLYRNNANYNVVQNGATAAGAGFYAGIARIMKAHNFGLLVDVYNNVPYSQALQGTGNLLPAYDKGVDIYKDLFRQIDTAFMVMKDATTGSTLNNLSANTFDLMFGAGGTQTQATLDAQKLKESFFRTPSDTS
ncbi:MAG: SusD/RagB family nutrient-binding outer membrane lipoprotein [Chryseobacterium sp.]|nr:MAG: SusD/RagB family nutrient-binding outer membrane lipoprotein [Chryseobacterium sp.]